MSIYSVFICLCSSNYLLNQMDVKNLTFNLDSDDLNQIELKIAQYAQAYSDPSMCGEYMFFKRIIMV